MDLRVVIEDKVPFAHGLLESVGAQVKYLPAGAIDSDVMREVDALITRTRTRCDARLLAGSRCSMIASATIGLDHVDMPWCESRGIEVANAPGCNAPAVAQYVLCSLLALGMAPRSTTLGIVGVGHVGSIVERWARALGYRVLLCDPPRARREGGDRFVTLGELAREADVITFHTPLTRSGDDATFHLAGRRFFDSLVRRPVIVNSARGAIVDTPALIDALRSGCVSHAVIDCWEGEPAISPELLALASIATPHIAGYSRQGKTRATAMAVAAVCRHFGLPLPAQTPLLDPVADTVTAESLTASYDPMVDTCRLKENPQLFENFRNNYDLRSEPCSQKSDYIITNLYNQPKIQKNMKFLTDEKLVIVGAAGMIGSNMAQTAMMMHLTPNICLYDPYAPALEGVAEELYHCAFEGVNLTFTSDIAEALKDAKYIVSSGGAARKAGMTREDLLKGNAQIAEQFGKDVRTYCPDVKHIVVIFNPADITGLITLLYSGLKPSQVTTLAALDSTRLQNELVKYLKVPAAEIVNCRTYGGHGEQMAVFASTTMADGKPLAEIIGTERMPEADWEALKVRVIQGGKHIIDLRGRSSFQSPAYLSIEMIAAAMGGPAFRWPAGCYVNNGKFDHIMMAMETTIDRNGVSYKEVKGTPEEQKELEESYKHLCTLRDEVIEMGVLPPISKWHELNPNID